MHTAQRAPVLLALQRTHGNGYVQRVVAGIQAKLKVAQPGDKYEQEADRVAEEVLRMPEPRVPRQPEMKEEEEEEPIMMKPLVQRQAEGSIHANSRLESRLTARQGSGRPLPAEVRSFMEPHFGSDFSEVRVHTDSEAVQMNRELNAQAFTHGSDVYFGAGRYAPGTTAGQRLLAHELTHVVQQTGGQVQQHGVYATQSRLVIQRNHIDVPEEEAIRLGSTSEREVPPHLDWELATGVFCQPLPKSVKDFFEPHFGHDFSRVQVHTDAHAAESALAINARAYTVGHEVVFGAGQYAPRTRAGRQLLSHEQAHVVHQSQAAALSGPGQVTRLPDDHIEREAHSAAQAVSAGRSVPILTNLAAPPVLQRHVTHGTQGRIGGAEQFLTGTRRYLFTRRGGWLDLAHVQPHIEQAASVMADLEARSPDTSVTSPPFTTRYSMDYSQIPPPIDQDKLEQVTLAIITDHDYRFETFQGSQVTSALAQSPFSYEDLPSDRVGVEIGLRYRRRARSGGLDPDADLGRSDSPQHLLLQEVTREVIMELAPATA
jgi:hypothetical protein